MIRRMLSALVLIAIFVHPIPAGEKPSLHLTGNPAVDFFSSSEKIDRAGLSGALMQEETGIPSSSANKSPWLAGALSLAVPGAGEFYSKSYIKAALFAALEATAWVVAYSYNKKGDRQTDDFHAYANAHWSAVQYAKWTLDNGSELVQPQYQFNPGNYDVFPDGIPAEGDPCGPPFGCIDWNEMNHMERDIASNTPEGGNGYTHQLPYYGEQQYYELIGKYAQFSRGWDDANLGPISPSNLPMRSNSQRFFDYALMRARTNDTYDIASTWVSVAVINHIVSALDAFWSATRYNNSLHAEVKMHVEPTQFGVVPVTEARLSYTF